MSVTYYVALPFIVTEEGIDGGRPRSVRTSIRQSDWPKEWRGGRRMWARSPSSGRVTRA
jgi:hypothetical protein